MNTIFNFSDPGNSGGRERSLPRKWTVPDIMVAAVVSVAVGVLFRGFDLMYGIVQGAAVLVYPPAVGLYNGLWMLAGVLGMMLIRKPGAALFCELVAATLSALLGSQWGFGTLLWGALQGLGAELVFMLAGYRVFNLLAASAAGTVSALFSGAFEVFIGSKIGWAVAPKMMYLGFMGVSGLIFVGGVSRWLLRRLQATGVLRGLNSGMGSGRKAQQTGDKVKGSTHENHRSRTSQ